MVAGMALAAGGYGAAGFVSARLTFAPATVAAPLASRLVMPLAPASVGTAVVRAALPPRLRVLRGVVSVHTERSHDAEGSLDEVAAAASRSGLDFVVLGDHPGAWTAESAVALPPMRLKGVVVVGGVELVIQDIGRVLVAGLDTVPRSWEGGVASLLERVPERGGFVSVIHPRSPRARERWKVRTVRPVHAWEALDVSEMARLRLEGPWAAYHLASFLVATATGHAHESLMRLNREGFGGAGLMAYDSARAAGPLTLTAGLNHHPKGRLLGGPFPSYEPFFNTMVNHVLVASPPLEDPAGEWARVAEGLRNGRSFVSLGDAQEAGGFAFAAKTPEGGRVEMGGLAAWAPGTTLRLDLPAVVGRLLVRILRDGAEQGWLDAAPASSVAWPVPGPGVYRVEVHRVGFRVGPLLWNSRPWLLTNAIELYRGLDRAAARSGRDGVGPAGTG